MSFFETVRSNKIASTAAAGVLAIVSYEAVSSHLDNRITVSQGKTCEGARLVDTERGDLVLDIATEQASQIDVDPIKAAYIGEFIMRSNNSSLFYENQDGKLASVGEPLVVPESCSL